MRDWDPSRRRPGVSGRSVLCVLKQQQQFELNFRCLWYSVFVNDSFDVYIEHTFLRKVYMAKISEKIFS